MGGLPLPFKSQGFSLSYQEAYCSAHAFAVSSDTTKERFISMFHFGDTLKTGERFRQTVLELVRLIQCGLSLFGLFSTDLEEQDGLLCDTTVEAIQKWVVDIGEPYLKVEVRLCPISQYKLFEF